MIEGPKKVKVTTAKARLTTTPGPAAFTSPLSKLTTPRGNLRTRPQTSPPVFSQVTEATPSRPPPSRATRPTVTRGTRPPVAVTVASETTAERTRPPRTRGPTRVESERPVVTNPPSRVRGRPTTQPPTYLPPQTTPEFSCGNPESENDPRCPPNCALNPKDSRCPKPTTPRPRTPETTTKFVCTPGSLDPRCAPDCYPGSRDPRCPQPTSPKPTTFVEVTTR